MIIAGFIINTKETGPFLGTFFQFCSMKDHHKSRLKYFEVYLNSRFVNSKIRGNLMFEMSLFFLMFRKLPLRPLERRT